MLGFAMDCFFAGMAICLFVGATDTLLKNNNRNGHDFFWVSLSYGLAIFLMTRFAMSLVITWSLWD